MEQEFNPKPLTPEYKRKLWEMDREMEEWREKIKDPTTPEYAEHQKAMAAFENIKWD